MGALQKVVLAAGMLLAGAPAWPQAQVQVDLLFGRWNGATPGCAVGVSEPGKPVLLKAYGMADLEHGVANTVDTVFEAGSLAKQITAAAIVLLAQDGKLALDDPVRKYLPELPDYGHPLTIRHLLTHTSGLRDWGGVVDMAGWPRGTRIHTQLQVLAIVARQRKLNFESGTRFAYSNTGYNLAAMIVERVSGKSFPAFTRERIFAPLGMRDSSWRDDFTRVVRNRAIGYAKQTDGYHAAMPFENVYGNGGLLTTIADLLKWNDNFARPVVGGPRLVADLQAGAKFNDGTRHGYALGLFNDSYRGLARVQHGGANAGYRAFLTRYPVQQLSLAVLCNAADAEAGAAADALADLFLAAAAPQPPVQQTGFAVPDAQLVAREGMYRDPIGRAVTLQHAANSLRSNGGASYLAIDARQMRSAAGTTLSFGDPGRMQATDRYGTVTHYQQVERVIRLPTAAALRELAGTYTSSDAEASWTVYVEGNQLMARPRSGLVLALTPLYQDGFGAGASVVLFRRNGAGRVTGLSVGEERVWDMPFEKQPGPSS